MLKAVDKVWYDGLIYKLRHAGISDEALALVNSFLNNRFQHVILWHLFGVFIANFEHISHLVLVFQWRVIKLATAGIHFRSPIFLSIY